MNLTRSGMIHSLLVMLIVGLMSTVSLAQESASNEAPAQAPAEKLGVGDHNVTVLMGQQQRTAIVHVPPNYNSEKPTPVVLALHGAVMTAEVMVWFCGLNETADTKGFITVYPNGTGLGPVQIWNAGGFLKGIESRADDVGFLKKLLDDVAVRVNVDPKRVYACGMSNGAMMCYRLAAELSDRIAAIAPVGGTMAMGEVHPVRPVSVIHFHGTLDTLVPYDIGNLKRAPLLKLRSPEESVQTWAKLNGIEANTARSEVISKEGDELKVIRQEYGPGNEVSEVVLITIEGGGHTWPGQVPPVELIGKSAMNISANEMLWAFFEKHPMK